MQVRAGSVIAELAGMLQARGRAAELCCDLLLLLSSGK